MDLLCDWCLDIRHALRQIMADHPDLAVTPVLSGLVAVARVRVPMHHMGALWIIVIPF
jgi:hypothetical protein